MSYSERKVIAAGLFAIGCGIIGALIMLGFG